MKHSPITTKANALQFYCNSLDADPKLSVEIATWLTSFNTAQSIVNQNEIDLVEAVLNWRATEKMAPLTLAISHLKHKPTDTPKQVAIIKSLCSSKDDLQNSLHLNKTALAIVGRDATKFVEDNVSEFIGWVAVQRCKDLTACGEAIPIEVETMWAKLDIRIYKWLEGLTMPADKMHLPLLYTINEPENYRASVAWVWQQLAEKQFKFVPISKTDPRPSVRLLGDIDTLPAVPKTIKTLTPSENALRGFETTFSKNLT